MLEAVCVKVSKTLGGKTLALLNKMGVVDKSLNIKRDGDYLCIPLVRRLEKKEWLTIQTQVGNAQLATAQFEEKTIEKTFIQILQEQVPPNLLESLPHAVDFIGDIAMIEIPSELKPFKNLVGNAILQTHKNVKTVLEKASAINGIYRTRDYHLIAGENKTSTVHHEYGCTFHVDVAKAYFSPRLSFEHKRVAALVKPGEIIVDLFAGVGPFSVLTAKEKSDVKVYALDINPSAVELLKINIQANRVVSKVYPVLGDARQVVTEQLHGVADRAIMNLPESAIEFVDVACQALKPSGGVIHFYAFVREPDSIEKLQSRFSKAVLQAGRKVERFLEAKSIRETAPFESQVVLDAKVL